MTLSLEVITLEIILTVVGNHNENISKLTNLMYGESC